MKKLILIALLTTASAIPQTKKMEVHSDKTFIDQTSGLIVYEYADRKSDTRYIYYKGNELFKNGFEEVE